MAVQCRTSAEGICLNTTCIHQCCPLYHFQNVNGLCELNRGLGSNLEWILQSTQEDVNASFYHPLYDSLKCDKITYNLSLYQWEFYKNGDLKIESSLYQAKDYCLNDIEEWDDESGTFQYWHDVHVCVHAEGDCKGDARRPDGTLHAGAGFPLHLQRSRFARIRLCGEGGRSSDGCCCVFCVGDSE